MESRVFFVVNKNENMTTLKKHIHASRKSVVKSPKSPKSPKKSPKSLKRKSAKLVTRGSHSKKAKSLKKKSGKKVMKGGILGIGTLVNNIKAGIQTAKEQMGKLK